jgi:hypothetical protein
MRYSLTNFVTAALGVFACAIALGVLTVPAWAITARVLGTFTPELCTCVRCGYQWGSSDKRGPFWNGLCC